jgi:4-amino-4-deoxy-L-arabinose transferase-like glycosyltransferase
VREQTDPALELQSPPTLPLTVFLLVLILISVGLRIVRFQADPPSNFCWSGGYFADEGYWSHNARNEVLFGKARMDEWDARVVAPLFAFVQSCMFRIFGVGIVQVRLVSLLSSAFLTLISFFLFRKYYSLSQAFFCAILITINYPAIVLGRQGILDPFATAIAWGALLFATSSRPALHFVSGLLITAACITKYLMIYTLVPVGFVTLIFPGTDKRNRGFFLLGLVTAAIVWFVTNYIPNRELLHQFNNYYSSQQSHQSWQIGALLKNAILQPFYLYFLKSPVILFFGNLMLWYLLSAKRSRNIVEKALLLWLISGVVLFAFWKYRPLRYYTALIPPLAGLAGLALYQMRGIAGEFKSGRFRWLMWVGLAIPFSQAIVVVADQLWGHHWIPSEVGIESADAVIFLVVSTLSVFFLLQPRVQLKWLAIVFVAGFLLSDIRNYLEWMIWPQYSAVEISKDLEQRAPDGVFTGQWAPELVLENRLRAVPVWKGFVNSNDPFKRFGITHLLMWRYPLGDEVEKFRSWYPEDFAKFRPVAHYSIKDSELLLYERIEKAKK